MKLMLFKGSFKYPMSSGSMWSWWVRPELGFHLCIIMKWLFLRSVVFYQDSQNEKRRVIWSCFSFVSLVIIVPPTRHFPRKLEQKMDSFIAFMGGLIICRVSRRLSLTKWAKLRRNCSWLAEWIMSVSLVIPRLVTNLYAGNSFFFPVIDRRSPV